MPQPYTPQAKALRWLPYSDRSATSHPYEALPSVPAIYARTRGKVQSALRYVKLKAEGLWPTCLVGGVRSRSKERRGGRTVRPMPSAWRKGQDMTVPIRTPCSVRGGCSIEGCERPRHARGWRSHHWRRWHRHGDPLASRCPRYTVDELWRLNALSRFPRWRAHQARGC